MTLPQSAPERAGRDGCPSTRRHGTVIAYHRDRCRCPHGQRAAMRYEKHRRIRKAAGHDPFLPAAGTLRRLRALSRIGWRIPDLADHYGAKPARIAQLLYETDAVTVDTARRVADLYDRLSDVDGPSPLAARRAELAGYLPPIAWDDDTIDDPDGRPYQERDDKGRVRSKWRPCSWDGCSLHASHPYTYCVGCRPKATAARAERDRQRMIALRPAPKQRVCALGTCGAVFVTSAGRHTYCTPECATTARRASWRQRQAQKKARRTAGLAVAS